MNWAYGSTLEDSTLAKNIVFANVFETITFYEPWVVFVSHNHLGSDLLSFPFVYTSSAYVYAW